MTRDFTKGARASFYLMLFVMGSVFWVATELDAFRMDARVYGSKAVQFPSEWWALGMLIPSAIYLIALCINGKHRATPYVRIACNFVISVYFSFFVVSAWPAAGGDLMVIASGVLMTKSAAMTFIDASELLTQRPAK